ncbi:ATP-binding protein [Jiulongibacter sp. NS-SX5]|uniref:ATP-binding protein n=1 Tax=Jiulongibacter sp. NS-SX5 TaxID=3463854 RepID=UPI004058FB29
MYIKRDLYAYLIQWKSLSSRLPLILRGARQVGKTTLVKEFGEGYSQFLYFNLERAEDFSLFANIEKLKDTLNLLFIARNFRLSPDIETLLFIDEVQEKPEVIEMLRYFHEDYPYLHVIVTGSLLEFGIEKIQKTPVGRVEYAELHPLNFREFLMAMNQNMLLEQIDTVPLPETFNPLLLSLFHNYVLIGGMPRIVAEYAENQNATALARLYASIIESYKTDVEKYASNDTQKRVIRHIINAAPFEIDNRIKLNNFGNSSFKTRDVKEAFDALQKAKLMRLIYPSTDTNPPLYPDLLKSPRLHFLDTGLVNYQLGIQQEILQLSDLNDASRGKLVQQIVLQELNSTQILPDKTFHFWVREERGTTSEVDIIYPYKKYIIPIEVKSGATGSLRSLHEFMDRCPHSFAVRIYAGKIGVDSLKTRKGKEYKLLNLPYFLVSKIEEYLEWFIESNNDFTPI